MEYVLNMQLDAVRLDAIARLKGADAGQNQVIDAAKDLMRLADRARKEGLLVLENMAETVSSDLLRQLILLVVDGTNPSDIIEIGTDIYWTKAPAGADAMVDYMYLRGMLGIQNGDNPRLLENILLSLMPSGLHQEYRAQMEILHQSADVEKLFSIHPTFQDPDIWEPIHNLEATLSGMPNRCIQRLLREVDNRELAICIYVLRQDVRKKVLANLSTGLSRAIMEDVALCVSVSEKDVAASVAKVADTINALQQAGEIIVPDNE